MDNLQAYALARLPPGVLQHLTTHSSTYWSIYQQIMAVNTAFQNNFVQPIYNNLLAPLVSRISSSPDLASVALFAVLLLVSLQVLNMAVRAMFFWIRLAVRLLFWSVVLGAVMWVYSRGYDGVMADVGQVQRVWRNEYKYWKQQEAFARRANGFW